MLKALFAPFVMLVVTSGFTFVAANYWFHRKLKQEEAERKLEADAALRKQVEELEQKLAVITSSVQPLNAAYQAMLIAKLTHAHTPRLDELLTKLGPPITLTRNEQDEMVVALEQRMLDMSAEISESERAAAKILPLHLLLVEEEVEKTTELKIVSVTKDQVSPAEHLE